MRRTPSDSLQTAGVSQWLLVARRFSLRSGRRRACVPLGDRMVEQYIETCHIHNRTLEGEDEVPVFYGFFSNGIEYGQAYRELFRYSRSWSPGGCSVAAGRPRTKTVKVCTACRAAELKWIKDFVTRNPDDSTFAWELAGHLGIPRPSVSPGTVFPALPICQRYETAAPLFPCPYCGRDLVSEKARQCLYCGMDWHDPYNVVQRGNPNWNRLGLDPPKEYVVELLLHPSGKRTTQYREADAPPSSFAILETTPATGQQFVGWGKCAYCEHLPLTDGRRFGFDANGVWLTDTEIEFMRNDRWWEKHVPWENGITPLFEPS